MGTLRGVATVREQLMKVKASRHQAMSQGYQDGRRDETGGNHCASDVEGDATNRGALQQLGEKDACQVTEQDRPRVAAGLDTVLRHPEMEGHEDCGEGG